jgi:hypothetical protein
MDSVPFEIIVRDGYGSISAANFFERGGGSCFNTGRQGTTLLIFGRGVSKVD